MNELNIIWSCHSESLSTNEMIQVLGVVPTLIWEARKPFQDGVSTRLTRLDNGIQIAETFNEPEDIEMCVKSFANKYHQAIEKLSNSGMNVQVRFACVLYACEARGIFFDRDIVKILASTNSSLHYDHYVFYDADEVTKYIQPQAHWYRTRRAQEEEITKLCRRVQYVFPKEYLDFLRINNGAEGELSCWPYYFRIYPTEHEADPDDDKITPEGFQCIGRSPFEGILTFDTRKEDSPIYLVSFSGEIKKILCAPTQWAEPHKIQSL